MPPRGALLRARHPGSLLVSGAVDEASRGRVLPRAPGPALQAKISPSPRAAVETRDLTRWTRVRGGSYYEPTRFSQQQKGDRVHVTFGLDQKLFPWQVFGLFSEGTEWRLSGALDAAGVTRRGRRDRALALKPSYSCSPLRSSWPLVAKRRLRSRGPSPGANPAYGASSVAKRCAVVARRAKYSLDPAATRLTVFVAGQGRYATREPEPDERNARLRRRRIPPRVAPSSRSISSITLIPGPKPQRADRRARLARDRSGRRERHTRAASASVLLAIEAQAGWARASRSRTARPPQRAAASSLHGYRASASRCSSKSSAGARISWSDRESRSASSSRSTTSSPGDGW